MTPEQFCYWLQGSLELGPEHMELDCVQVQKIKDHLALVFTKVTPTHSNQTYCQPTPAEDMAHAFATMDRLCAGPKIKDAYSPLLETLNINPTVQEEGLIKLTEEEAQTKFESQFHGKPFTLGSATQEPKPWPTS